MNPLSIVERLFSGIGSAVSRIGALYRQGEGAAKKPWLRRIVVTLVLLVLLAGLVFLALAILPQLPMRFWQVLGLCVVALVVLWWFTAGQRKASLKGRTRKRIGDLGPGNADDEREPVRRMAEAIGAAKRTIARSPDIDKGPQAAVPGAVGDVRRRCRRRRGRLAARRQPGLAVPAAGRRRNGAR